MRYVGLLRAVNLAGKRKVPMADLRDVMADLGHEDVTTLLQSGNVVFSAPRTAVATLAGRIEVALEDRFGFAVPTMIRTGAQLERIIADNPFPDGDDHPTQLHVSFADGPVKAAALQGVDTDAFAPEAFRAGQEELYLWFPNGAGRAKMKVPFEKLLGVRLTARNWNTVLKLRDLLSEP